MGTGLDRGGAGRAAALGAVLGVDALLRLREVRRPAFAALDWTAHLATALLALGAPRRGRRPLPTATVLAATIAIDLDHLPAALGPRRARWRGADRPASHCALTAGLLLSAGVVPRLGRVAPAAAAAVAVHLVRDMATGGVPLAWPLRAGQVRLPYAAYAAALAALATAGPRRPRR